MPDLKISGLTALTAADTADLLEIVDVSDTTMAATGTNKKITTGQVLASGLPATFGATNVSTLAASGNVAVNTTMPAWSSLFRPIQIGLSNAFISGRTDIVSQLHIGTNVYFDGTNWKCIATGNVSRYYQNTGGHIFSTASFSTTGSTVTFDDTATISSTGLAVTGAVSATTNISAGTTLSSWGSGYRAVQLPAGSLYADTGYGGVALAHNCYFNGTNFIYQATGSASIFEVSNKKTTFYSVNSGTAGATLTFTQVLSVEKDKSLALQGAVSQTGAGITFPATVSASTDVNTLDDYVEYTAASAACTGALTDAAVWKLTKIGNKVTLKLPFVVGTASAAASFTFGTVLPAAYRPATNAVYVSASIKDNNTAQTASGAIFVTAATGAISVFKDGGFSNTFSAAANTGLGYETSVSWTV